MSPSVKETLCASAGFRGAEVEGDDACEHAAPTAARSRIEAPSAIFLISFNSLRVDLSQSFGAGGRRTQGRTAPLEASRGPERGDSAQEAEHEQGLPEV